MMFAMLVPESGTIHMSDISCTGCAPKVAAKEIAKIHFQIELSPLIDHARQTVRPSATII
jgi:hypothetical protein